MNNRPKQWINLNGTQNDWLMCVCARESVSDWKITLKMYRRICLVSSKINVECASNDNNCTYFSRLKMGTKFTHTTFDAECNEKSVNSIRKSWQIHGICLFFCLDFFGRFWSTVCVCPSTFSKCTIETITKCAKYCRERRRSEIESNEQESREKKNRRKFNVQISVWLNSILYELSKYPLQSSVDNTVADDGVAHKNNRKTEVTAVAAVDAHFFSCCALFVDSQETNGIFRINKVSRKYFSLSLSLARFPFDARRFDECRIPKFHLRFAEIWMRTM